MTNTIADILIVDDDIGDIELMEEMLEQSKLILNHTVVYDGQQAMDYLLGTGDFERPSQPDIILLDLNMPRKNGQDTLKEIKANPNLRHIPVVVLTTSSDDVDILKSYISGASCFISKPIGLDQFKTVVSMISDFWFTVVKLPPKK